MKWVAGLAAAAVWLVTAMPALAQPTPKSMDDLTEDQVDEFYCVYDSLDFFADVGVLVNGYVNGETETPAYKAQLKEFAGATEDCADDFDWTAERSEAASVIGFYSLLGDELDARLASYGMSKEVITGLYDFYEGLPDDDINKFVDGVWAGDAALMRRLKAGLAAKGVAGDAAMRDASFLAEAYIIVSLMTYDWLSKMPAN